MVDIKGVTLGIIQGLNVWTQKPYTIKFFREWKARDLGTFRGISSVMDPLSLWVAESLFSLLSERAKTLNMRTPGAGDVFLQDMLEALQVLQKTVKSQYETDFSKLMKNMSDIVDDDPTLLAQKNSKGFVIKMLVVDWYLYFLLSVQSILIRGGLYTNFAFVVSSAGGSRIKMARLVRGLKAHVHGKKNLLKYINSFADIECLKMGQVLLQISRILSNNMSLSN